MTLERKHKLVLIIAMVSLSLVFGATVLIGDNNSDQKKELEELTIRNWDTKHHDITVILENDRRVRYWRKISLNGTTTGKNVETKFDRVKVSRNFLGGDITEYKIFVKVNASGYVKRYEFDDQATRDVINSCERKEHVMIAITIRSSEDLRHSVTCER